MVVQRQARHSAAAFVGDQLKVVGFTANNAAQRNQRIKLCAFSHRLQSAADLKRARHLDVGNTFDIHMQCGQLAQAGLSQCVGNAFIKARLHDTDRQFFAVELVAQAFFCTKHGFFLLEVL